MSGPSNPPIPGASFPGGDSVPFSSAVDAKKDKPDDTVPGSSAAGEAGGWQTNVKKRKRANRGKPNVKQSEEVVGKGGKPRGRQAGSQASLVPDQVHQQRKLAKQCFGCGSAEHYIGKCPVANPKGKAKTSDPARIGNKPSTGEVKGKSTPQKSAEPGQKRRRDAESSGFTPPAKKSTAKKHSYAAAAADALEVAIVTKDKGHISRKSFEDIRAAVEDKWLAQLEEGVEPFAVDAWFYSSTMATFSVPNDISAGQVEMIVRAKGYLALPKNALLDERKPTKVLTGLISGPAASRDRPTLERLLAFEKKRVGICGRMEYHSATIVQKSGNLLLRIVADEDAVEGLKKVDFELRIGASGKVKFSDPSAEKKLNPEQMREKKRSELEESIAADKLRIKERLAELRALNEETELVGSMGMSGMTVEDSEKMEVSEKDKEEKTV